MDIRTPPHFDFLRDGGETGALIHAYDWANTPIGPIPGWPQSLKTTVGLMLRSPVPMVLLWGRHGVMIYNDPYSVFAAGRHPRLLGSNVLEGWPEVADFNAHVMKVGMGGGTLSYRDQELTLYRKVVPEQVWMNLDYSPVIDESGQPGGVLAIVVETTDRVKAEAALRESETRLRGVLDGMGESLALLDQDFRIIDMNAEALRLEGRPREDVIGKTHWEAHPDADPALGEMFRHAMAARKPVSLKHRYVWGHGRVSWISMNAYPVGQGLAVFYGDITDKVEAEERLRESEERLRLMADAVPQIIWITDSDGRHEFFNRQWFLSTPAPVMSRRPPRAWPRISCMRTTKPPRWQPSRRPDAPAVSSRSSIGSAHGKEIIAGFSSVRSRFATRGPATSCDGSACPSTSTTVASPRSTRACSSTS